MRIAVVLVAATVAATAFRDGELLAECALVFSFHEFDSPRLEARRAEVLALWTRDLTPDGKP